MTEGAWWGRFVCVEGCNAQSTHWGHVERSLFTLPHFYCVGLTSIEHILLPEIDEAENQREVTKAASLMKKKKKQKKQNKKKNNNK